MNKATTITEANKSNFELESQEEGRGEPYIFIDVDLWAMVSV